MLRGTPIGFRVLLLRTRRGHPMAQMTLDDLSKKMKGSISRRSRLTPMAAKFPVAR